MTALHLTLHAFPNEPAMSLASRIAMKLRITNVSDLILDLGINWPDFRNGRPTAICQFAEMVGADADDLTHATFAPRPEGRFGFRGHLLDRPMVNRRAVRVCPRCIMDDHERGGTVGRHSRSHWQLTQIRTCTDHGSPIRALLRQSETLYEMDVAQIIEENFAEIRRFSDVGPPQPNGFESWLMRRLADETSDQWVDRIPISAAVQFCEKAEVALCFGPDTAPLGLEEKQLTQATEAAFQRLTSATDGIQLLLADIWEKSQPGRARYTATFGNLWRWLVKVKADHRYDLILDEVARFVFNNQPFAAGDTLLGRECKQRRYHTVQSAAEAYGLKTSRTSCLLQKLADDHGSLVVKDVDRMLSTITSCLPRVKAAKRLGVATEMFDRLRRTGHVQVAFSTEKVADLYDIGDLDKLWRTIFEQAQIVSQRPPNCSRVVGAAGAASIYAEKILTLIIDGKLGFVGQQVGRTKVTDILVDRDELRDLVYGPEAPRPETKLTVEQARKALHLNTETIAWFMREGYLPTTRHGNKRGRRDYRLLDKANLNRLLDKADLNRLLDKADLNAFADKYVSLGALAAEARIQANHVARRLERNGIIPLDFPPHLNKIFLREAVQPPEHVGRLSLS